MSWIERVSFFLSHLFLMAETEDIKAHCFKFLIPIYAIYVFGLICFFPFFLKILL